MKRKKIAMTIRTGEDGNVVGDDVVGDTRHGFLTNGAGDGGTVLIGILWRDRVEIPSCYLRNEIGHEGRNKMATTVKAFVD